MLRGRRARNRDLRDRATHRTGRFAELLLPVRQDHPVLARLAVGEGLGPDVLGWTLVPGRVDATDTLVRPSKEV